MLEMTWNNPDGEANWPWYQFLCYTFPMNIAQVLCKYHITVAQITFWYKYQSHRPNQYCDGGYENITLYACDYFTHPQIFSPGIIEYFDTTYASINPGVRCPFSFIVQTSFEANSLVIWAWNAIMLKFSQCLKIILYQFLWKLYQQKVNTNADFYSGQFQIWLRYYSCVFCHFHQANVNPSHILRGCGLARNIYG